MSDQFYAVQFRSKRKIIHNIAIFSYEKVAQDFFDYIEDKERLPMVEECNFIGIEEIYENKKPFEFEDMEVLYINEWDKNRNVIPYVDDY